MTKLFAPATALMARLRFRPRFVLITVLFLLPLTYALWAFVSTSNSQINFSQKEAWGNEYMRPLHSFYRHTIDDWMLSQEALHGSSANNEALAQNEALLDQDLQALAAIDAKYGADLGTTARLSALQQNWEAIKALPQNDLRQQKYASLVADVRGILSVVGDKSNLILDPDLDSYYTMDAVLLTLPAMQNTIADLSVKVYGVLASGRISPTDKTELTLLKGPIFKYDDNLTKGAEVAFANNPVGNLEPAVAGPLNDARIALNNYLTMLDEQILLPETVQTTPAAWMQQTEAALAASYAQWDVQSAQLDVIINKRVSALEGNRLLAIAITLVALLVVVYMWIGFYGAVMRSVTNLEKTADMLASGNVAGAISLGARDEMSQTAAAAMNLMASTTNQMSTAIEQRTSELTEVSYLLAYMHDGVIITDESGAIKVLNGTATRMLNTQYDDAVGQPLFTLVRDARLVETVRAAINAPTQRFAVDLPLYNRLISVTVTFVPVEESMTGMFVLQDVTELRTLQQQQQFARATYTR